VTLAVQCCNRGRPFGRAHKICRTHHRHRPGWDAFSCLVGGLFLPDGLPEAVQLNRSGVSDLSKPAQGGVTTIGTFNYFAGYDPTGIVFLAAGRKK